MSYKDQELLTLRGAHSTPSFSNLVINQKYKKTMYVVYALQGAGTSYPSRGTFDPGILDLGY